MRYLRYIRRKRKDLARQLKLQKKEEKKATRHNMKEHLRQLREDEHARQQYERDRQKKEQQEIRQRLKHQSFISEDIRKEETHAERIRRKQEKKLARKKRRRLFLYTTRIRARNSWRALKHFRLSDIGKGWKRNKGSIKKFLLITLNSTTLFLLSYLLLFMLIQGVTVLAAKLFHYPTILYYYEVYFNIGVEDWYHDSVKTIFSAGPITALFTGIIFMLIYNNRKELSGLFKLFFLWGFLHGTSMFFGAMLVGTLFEKGIGHVISWMYVMDTGKLLYSIISLFMLVMAGMICIKPFLISGNTYFQYMSRENRRYFVWAQVIMPFILGMIILLAMRQPHFMFYETFVTMTLAISLLPIVLAYPAYTDLYFEEEKKPAYFDWRYFLILVAVILIYRGIFSFGINIPG